ncbi:MAG TPA: nitroreductase family protein [Rectinemataceae bacterium]|nr:nitroreductase family protein [Rectinemataceae bacterium]
MGIVYSAEENGVLDSIIENRRSVRAFLQDPLPDRDMIEAVAKAGLWAPYAAAMTQAGPVFRKFVIVQHHSPVIAEMHALIREQTKATIETMKRNSADKPLPDHAKVYVERMGKAVENGFPGFEEAPALIIAAERRANMQVERKSLAHVVQNMWLKATALGLGLQLLSVIEMLSERAEFSELLGMSHGEFTYAGCIIGYPAQAPAPGQRPQIGDVTRWI